MSALARYQDIPTSDALRRLADTMVGQESADLAGALLHRWFRFYQGDPSLPIAVTSTGPGNVQSLPDNPVANSATFQVQGNTIAYTLDGTNPGAASATAPVGAVITLTGQPSIKGFKFQAASAVAASVAGSYYT